MAVAITVVSDVLDMFTVRVVSSEISGNLFRSFRKFIEEFFPMSVNYVQVQ